MGKEDLNMPTKVETYRQMADQATLDMTAKIKDWTGVRRLRPA